MRKNTAMFPLTLWGILFTFTWVFLFTITRVFQLTISILACQPFHAITITYLRARASALFYSLIETAKANGLELSRYLRYLFEKYPYAKTSEDIFNLLPINVSEIDLKK